ncbi:MAG: hypothetical protein NT039_02140 [Candidatus Berkelbacteria bacterium]|nr:hypothetical protein [Candidatus Berkelbacteria bacterium]
MMKKLFIFLGLALTFLVPSIVSADILEPGMKEIDYCFQVENIKDYSEYVFLSYFQEPVGGHKVINQGDCVSFYKFSNPTIYAIKKGDFNENEIGSTDEQEKNYFQNNKKLIASGLSIKSIGSVKENDPRQKVVDVYKIESLDSALLKIFPLKVIYTYTDGTSEEKIYQSQPNSTETPKRPEPSKKTFLPYWFSIIWYIVLPLIALIIIIAILIYRRTKK